MIRLNSTIPLIFAVIAVAAPVRGDMKPILLGEALTASQKASDDVARLRETQASELSVSWLGSGYHPAAKRCRLAEGVRQTLADREVAPVTVLNDRHGSMALCLYALMGLGLCKTAPLMRKLNFGVIPEWYHDGGPFRIGHSLAVSPDCAASASACFIQPDALPRGPAMYHRATPDVLTPSGRQYAPSALASRAPPFS